MPLAEVPPGQSRLADDAGLTGSVGVTDDFDREIDAWLDSLEGRLAPVGRQTAPGPDERGAQPSSQAGRTDPTPVSRRPPSVPGLRRRPSHPTAADAEADRAALAEGLGLADREARLARQHQELIRFEELVAGMRELAAEVRSVRRDVDQIKAIIARLRRLIELKRGSPRRIPPFPTAS